MSLNSVVSVILGFVIIIGSLLISTDTPSTFFNIPSIVIVVGGTLVTAFISYEFKTALSALRLIGTSFKKHRDSAASLKDEVARIVSWAYVIQKTGLQGLENEIDDQLHEEEPFLAYGGDLVVTGYTGLEIRQIMNNLLQSQHNKEDIAIEGLKKMGGDAPAYGMLGTLIGLIVMLGDMGANPGAIGPSMAIALITTFYGILLARIFFIPVATKMAARLDVSTFKNTLQMEGLVLLAERKSPRYIQDRINSFVELDNQFSIDRDINLSAMAYTSPAQTENSNEQGNA
ncbi:MAG: MotA/TolQ/ExbB proton channel family protein [Lactobacillus sp.]|jgi:chemotaxis protein MotA|nr:MotA/TolQ/ExbB proton channel family protein [Lactobacillus sp.]